MFLVQYNLNLFWELARTKTIIRILTHENTFPDCNLFHSSIDSVRDNPFAEQNTNTILGDHRSYHKWNHININLKFRTAEPSTFAPSYCSCWTFTRFCTHLIVWVNRCGDKCNFSDLRTWHTSGACSFEYSSRLNSLV